MFASAGIIRPAITTLSDPVEYQVGIGPPVGIQLRVVGMIAVDISLLANSLPLVVFQSPSLLLAAEFTGQESPTAY